MKKLTYESLPKEFKNKSIADLEIRKDQEQISLVKNQEEGEYILNPARKQL